MKRFSAITCALLGSMFLASTPAAAQEFRSNADTDGDGVLSVDEFVMAFAAFDMRRFDTNKDEVLEIAEFTAKDTKYKQMLVKKFNTDKDGVFSASEMVEMYLSMFGNRDKDGSGTVSVDESPGHFLKKQN